VRAASSFRACFSPHVQFNCCRAPLSSLSTSYNVRLIPWKARLGPGLGVIPLDAMWRKRRASAKDNRRLPSGDSLNGPQNKRTTALCEETKVVDKECRTMLYTLILRHASEAVWLATTQHNNYLENTNGGIIQLKGHTLTLNLWYAIYHHPYPTAARNSSVQVACLLQPANPLLIHFVVGPTNTLCDHYLTCQLLRRSSASQADGRHQGYFDTNLRA
jgi:hypothetical protein